MSTAFSVAYPSERSGLGRALRPLIEPRAYLRAIHLLLMFPLGLGYFIFFVTAFAFGGALIWTFVGPPVLLLALFISLYIGDLEAWMVNLTTGEGIRRPPKVLEGVTSLREKVWTRVIDPSTWTGVIYQVAQFPVGVAAFVVVVVGFSVSGAFIAAPILAGLSDEASVLGIDDPITALPLVPVGILGWLITMHVVTVFSSMHAAWARIMLGTRARRRPQASLPAAPELEPEPEPGARLALLPPIEAAPPETVDDATPSAAEDSSTAEGNFDAHADLRELTPREREVLLLVVRGYSNADICEALYVSEGTVKTHVRHILAKLGLIDRTQAVVFAYEHGLIAPSRRAFATASSR